MTNEELDRKVAEDQGWWNADGMWMSNDDEAITTTYSPSTNWQQAGELMEKYKIDLHYEPMADGKNWHAAFCGNIAEVWAETPQRAICLAVLALPWQC
jgi:hypothetical protein